MHMQAKNILMSGLNTILPPRCPVSGDIVDAQGQISPKIWGELDFISKPFCAHCGIALDLEVLENGKCIKCLDNPPVFSSSRSVFKYNDLSRNLILGFKHGDKTHYVSSFVPFLEQVGKLMLERADFLVPVPLHPRRLIARRYNQAALISGVLSKSCGVKHLPLAMRRVRSTPSQGHLNSGDRIKNVQKAFDVHKKYHSLLKDKSVVLIDDVYTTGATVKECSKILLKHGVAEVNILTIARVMLDD